MLKKIVAHTELSEAFCGKLKNIADVYPEVGQMVGSCGFAMTIHTPYNLQYVPEAAPRQWEYGS